MASYEPLKCDHCGKTLGYIRIDVKVYPPKFLTHLVFGGPLIKVENIFYVKNAIKVHNSKLKFLAC